MNDFMFSNFEVEWKRDYQISPLRYLIRTSMFTITVILFLMRLKKIRFRSDSCNRSFPIPSKKVSVFSFLDNGNCYLRFRLKTCSGSFNSGSIYSLPRI